MKMKTRFKWLATLFILAVVVTWKVTDAVGQPVPDHTARAFSLLDLKGTRYDLNIMKDRLMMILYFFDVDSPSSREGLKILEKLAGRYSDAELEIWGITRSSSKNVALFVNQTGTPFPILLDTSNVSDVYQARFVLPTICILGPKLKVLDFIQGGGKSTEVMLTKLAERQLQRKKYDVAIAFSDEVVKKDPNNTDAALVKGYAALKLGKVELAEKTFAQVADRKGEDEILGQEGLAGVYERKGEAKKAMALADQLTSKAPDRSYAHMVKGNILYRQNEPEKAEVEYRKAAGKQAALPHQKATALNKLGRLKANSGQYQEARELYKQAVDIDPYYIEATSNTAYTYEKEGQWGKALDTYRQALAVDKTDAFSAEMARKAQEMLVIQDSAKQKERMDRLVKELAKRYREQQKARPVDEDTWTSRSMVLTFLDFQEKGALSERDGLSVFVTSQLSNQLNDTGRVQVVERILVERLLEELNLGSSELADPETALRLGKVLAAKLIGTGTMIHLADGTLLSMRLIDTETSALPGVINLKISAGGSLQDELSKLNTEVLQTVVSKYPLQGYIVQYEANRVMLNIGAKQGVKIGSTFEVIKEQAPVEYKGKLLHGAPRVVAQIEVVQVEPDLCYCKVLNEKESINRDDKVKERQSKI